MSAVIGSSRIENSSRASFETFPRLECFQNFVKSIWKKKKKEKRLVKYADSVEEMIVFWLFQTKDCDIGLAVWF